MQERKRIRAVRGYEGSTLTLDDLWRVFSCYGEVASVIIEPGRGATVTYRDQCSFPELEPGAELELVCGEQRLLVSRHQVWPLEGAEWPQQHHCTTTFRPRPLLPALAPAQPALRRRHPGRGEALARAPLQPQRAPTPCRRHGHGQGGRRRDLRGRSAGRGLGLRQDDTRLLVPARPKSSGGGRRRKGSRAGEEWQQVNICGWCGICIAGTFQTQNNL